MGAFDILMECCHPCFPAGSGMVKLRLLFQIYNKKGLALNFLKKNVQRRRKDFVASKYIKNILGKISNREIFYSFWKIFPLRLLLKVIAKGE